MAKEAYCVIRARSKLVQAILGIALAIGAAVAAQFYSGKAKSMAK